MTNVLFVCLGNICRSPLAMGYFKHLLHQGGLEAHITTDSAGTSRYNIGDKPDIRTRRNAESHGISLSHKARQVTASDFELFDYLIVMDYDNQRDLMRLSNNPAAISHKVMLLRSFDPAPGNGAVLDPYYGSENDFEEVFQIMKRALPHLLDFLLKEHPVKINTAG